MTNMTTFDDIFAAGPDASSHPKLRFWKQRQAQPDVSDVRCEVIRQPRDVLGYKPAKLYVHFYGPGGAELQCDETDWDDALNAGVVGLGVRAVSEGNEALRFSLALRAAFRPAERRYGDGYFNAVLVEWVRTSSFAQAEPVRELLANVHANPPYRGDGGSYESCRDLVQTAVRGRAMELTGCLRYPREEAEGILAAALAQYLDERFSVSIGRAFGWK
jgi:hypothetical protein